MKTILTTTLLCTGLGCNVWAVDGMIFDNEQTNVLTAAAYTGGSIEIRNHTALLIQEDVAIPQGSTVTVWNTSSLEVNGATIHGNILLKNTASMLINAGQFGGPADYSGTTHLDGRNSLTIKGGNFGGGMFAGAISTSMSAAAQSHIEISGGAFGGSGFISGQIALCGSSTATITGGTFGAEGEASGRLHILGQSSAHVLGGRFGGNGIQAGQVWVRDDATCRIEGGEFIRPAYPANGLDISLADQAKLVVAGCEFNLPMGVTPLPVIDPWLSGTLPNGGRIHCPVVLTDPFITTPVMELQTSALCITDADFDGIPDAEDAFPNSDTRPTVAIGTCDSGVVNSLLDNGTTIMDLVNLCAQASKNHGKFVNSIAKLTNDLKGSVLTGEQKASIMGCAAGSTVGK